MAVVVKVLTEGDVADHGFGCKGTMLLGRAGGGVARFERLGGGL